MESEFIYSLVVGLICKIDRDKCSLITDFYVLTRKYQGILGPLGDTRENEDSIYV